LVKKPVSILFLAVVIGFSILLFFPINGADWGFFPFFLESFFLHEMTREGFMVVAD
jgi:hypothetical protein